MIRLSLWIYTNLRPEKKLWGFYLTKGKETAHQTGLAFSQANQTGKMLNCIFFSNENFTNVIYRIPYPPREWLLVLEPHSSEPFRNFGLD